MERMKVKLFSAILITLASATVACLGYRAWHSSATPYGARQYSPDGKYYVQHWQVWTPSRLLFVTPGNGSDRLDGFIRLHSADGKIVREKFVTFLVGSEVRIYDDVVYGMSSDLNIDWKLE